MLDFLPKSLLWMSPFLFGFSFAEGEGSGGASEEEETSEADSSDDSSESDEVSTDDYKELQSEFTKMKQEMKELKEENELLSQETDWGQFQPEQTTSSPDTNSEGEDEIVTKRDLSAYQKNMQQRIKANQLLQQFRTDNPDLQDYEDIVDYQLRAKTNPKKPMEKRLQTAVEKTREFLKKEREKGRKSVEEQKQKEQEEEAKASGLGGSAKPSSEGEEEEKTGEEPDDYVAARRKLKNQKRTL